MANDIVVAADETAATRILHDAEKTLVVPTQAGSASLAGYNTSWSLSVNFTDGDVSLTPPDVIRLANVQLHYSITLSIPIDLNAFLPPICPPPVCFPVPFVGLICVPLPCITWPTINVPVSISDTASFSADFALTTKLVSGVWQVEVAIVRIPKIDLGPAANAVIAALGPAVAGALAPIPLAGIAVPFILASISTAAVTGLLGTILAPLLSNLKFTIYKQPQQFQILGAAGAIDPAVFITLLDVEAAVQASDKNELVLSVDI